MEITSAQQRMVEDIKNRMECPLDFKCEKAGFSDYPKVRSVGDNLECLEEEAPYCPFTFPCHEGNLCRCPLNNYVHSLEAD